VTILFGVLLMLSGAIGAVYGFFQNDAVTLAINSALETANDMRRVINAGYAGVILGTVAFVVGMFTAALGQLLLVFVDLAVQTRETNVILRGFRLRAVARQLNSEAEKYDQKEEVYG
jgi:hypothetical protein